MKKITGILIFAFMSFLLINDDILAAGWEKSFDLSLNATQSSYSNSWVGGEAGNFTWVANGNGIFSKQLTPIFNLRNTVKLAFGETHSQDKETKKWAKPVKSTDQIDIESLGLFSIKAFIQPYVAFRFESQFMDASVTNHNRYINPMLLTESAGLARQILKKDKNEILTRLGFAFKENINRSLIQDQVDTSIYTTKTITATDGGVESVTDAKLVLSDKLGYIGKLSLFKPFFYSKKDDYKGTPEENYWKAIKVNWENSMVASVSKYVQVVFYVQWLYEKQVSLKGRLKETLAFGLTYKLL